VARKVAAGTKLVGQYSKKDNDFKSWMQNSAV